jgi:hypothetical protein
MVTGYNFKFSLFDASQATENVPLPILTYGSESWPLTRKDVNIL